MPGESDLSALLRGLRPALHPHPYRFCCYTGPVPAPLALAAFALVHEDEGTTVIAPAQVADQYGHASEPAWARITLEVHSALDAVGMIAAISARLASVGVSANPIAGYYHDHLFVQWGLRDRALAAIEALSREARAGAESI